jgi:hypothetical protein
MVIYRYVTPLSLTLTTLMSKYFKIEDVSKIQVIKSIYSKILYLKNLNNLVE